MCKVTPPILRHSNWFLNTRPYSQPGNNCAVTPSENIYQGTRSISVWISFSSYLLIEYKQKLIEQNEKIRSVIVQNTVLLAHWGLFAFYYSWFYLHYALEYVCRRRIKLLFFFISPVFELNKYIYTHACTTVMMMMTNTTTECWRSWTSRE